MPGTSLVRWGGPLCGAHLFVTQGPVGTQRVQPRTKKKKRDRHSPRWLRVGASTSTFPKCSLYISHKAYSLPDIQNFFCRICIFLFPSAGSLPNIFSHGSSLGLWYCSDCYYRPVGEGCFICPFSCNWLWQWCRPLPRLCGRKRTGLEGGGAV